MFNNVFCYLLHACILLSPNVRCLQCYLCSKYLLQTKAQEDWQQCVLDLRNPKTGMLFPSLIWPTPVFHIKRAFRVNLDDSD